MREISEHYDVSLNAVVYFMRTFNIERRSHGESNKVWYDRQIPSFSLKKTGNKNFEEFDVVGAMLYWAEGYKRETASGVDFANSDPDMILVFLNFLRNRYVLNKRKLHFSLYYYANQDRSSLIRFWTQKLKVPENSFRNHYCKKNPTVGARELPYGVLHVRYNDKKLLRDVLNLIESLKYRYCVGGRAVNYTSL